MKNKRILIYFLVVLFGGILSSNAQTTTSEEVKSLIKKKRAFNKKNGYGFRIQLDNGLETPVKTTQEKFKLEFPEIKTYILFESPEWKVQVGDYKTRIEADKNLRDIKRKFPAAIVVPR
jgi:hypothetical protein